jgi:hypothetical protein
VRSRSSGSWQERCQLGQRRGDPLLEHVEVGHGCVIGDQPERDPPRVGDHRDADGVVGGERDDRYDVRQGRAERVQAPGGPGTLVTVTLNSRFA